MTDKKATIHPIGAAAIGAMVGAGVAAGAAVAMRHPKVKQAIEQMKIKAKGAMQDAASQVGEQIGPVKEQVIKNITNSDEEKVSHTMHKRKSA